MGYAVLEKQVWEQNLITRFTKVQAKNGPSANNHTVTGKKLSTKARVLSKGFAQAAEHKLNQIKEPTFLPAGKPVLALGLASDYLTTAMAKVHGGALYQSNTDS